MWGRMNSLPATAIGGSSAPRSAAISRGPRRDGCRTGPSGLSERSAPLERLSLDRLSRQARAADVVRRSHQNLSASKRVCASSPITNVHRWCALGVPFDGESASAWGAVGPDRMLQRYMTALGDLIDEEVRRRPIMTKWKYTRRGHK